MSSAPKRHSPAIGTVIGGLMLLAIAVAVLAGQMSSGAVVWDALGPYAVIGLGALLAVIGLVALRARR